MTNEQHLIFSYFSAILIAGGIGVAAYLVLRRSLIEITRMRPKRPLFHIVRRLFPIGIVLPAIAGAFSVSFPGCDTTYRMLLENRALLLARNQEQVSTSFFYTVVALLACGFVVLGVLIASRRRSQGSPRH